MKALETIRTSDVRCLADAELDQVSGGAEFHEIFLGVCRNVIVGTSTVTVQETGTLGGRLQR